MKRIGIILAFVTFFLSHSIAFGQLGGTTKICPGTPLWRANRPMLENQKEMFEEYAKGPDGCWWMKIAKFTSYKEGFYQWDSKTKYYYNKRKKRWETGDRRSILAKSPFG